MQVYRQSALTFAQQMQHRRMRAQVNSEVFTDTLSAPIQQHRGTANWTVLHSADGR